MFDLISILLMSIREIGAVLVIIGVLIAFLWKAAAYINFGLGLIITLLVTYFVYVVGRDMGFAVVVFFVGFIASAIMAAIGGFMCLFESFVLSSLGFWALFIGGSPLNILSPEAIFGSVIASIFSTGISAYLGSRAFSMGLIKRLTSTKAKQEKPQETSKPIPVIIEPESPGTSSAPASVPTTKRVEPDLLTKKRILGYVIAYRQVKLEELSSRFKLSREQVEDTLLDILAEQTIRGYIDRKTDTFILEA